MSMLEKQMDGISLSDDPLEKGRCRYARTMIEQVVAGNKVAAHAARAILRTKWDGTDPLRVMRYKPDQVWNFLAEVDNEISMYGSMKPDRRNYLQVIFNAFCHRHPRD